MRALNCKATRYAIEEADLNHQLSTTVLAHLRGCHECRNFYEERSKLRELVATLRTVEAPPDFEFRLRARIANLETSRGSFFAPGKFRFGLSRATVAPASLALLVLILGLGIGVRGVRILTGENEKPAITSSLTVAASDKEIAGQNTPELLSKANIENGMETAPLAQGSDVRRPTASRGFVEMRVAGARGKSRTVAKDFGYTPAPVFRKEDSVASAGDVAVFQIGASYQSLNVSVDDGSGEPKTISLPSVSFGSQRVFTSGRVPLAATDKGVW